MSLLDVTQLHGLGYMESNIRGQATRLLHRTLALQVTKFIDSISCCKLYREEGYLFTRLLTSTVDVTMEDHPAIIRSCDCVLDTLTL